MNAVFFVPAIVFAFGFNSEVSPTTAGDPADQFVRVRIAEGVTSLNIALKQSARLTGAGDDITLPAGAYQFRLRDNAPAKERFHLFVKTFYPNQAAEEKTYLDAWRANGYEPEVVVVGKLFRLANGETLDNRLRWVSLVRFVTEADALAAKARLEKNDQWSWMHAEIVSAGKGSVTIADAKGTKIASVGLPIALESSGGIELEAARRTSYTGSIALSVGPDEKLSAIESVAIESYLRGVLPSEMPSSWPMEALKAQAVAARSEVLAHLAGKHQLEGVDFCNAEHCRAYRGSANGDSSTDAAIDATRGTILLQGSRVAATVFSSNCGGWTEHNDAVWSAPPDASLRGVADTPSAPREPVGENVRRWLSKPPASYCQTDSDSFRWRKSYSTEELSAMVGKQHRVGRIRSIELGERGVSGRLKWVKVNGASGSVTIRKELPIRQAFGNLPSALFVVDAEPSANPNRFTFIGGGRGHGVGLCQYGARGMADRGIVYTEILLHYFSGVRIERFQ